MGKIVDDMGLSKISSRYVKSWRTDGEKEPRSGIITSKNSTSQPRGLLVHLKITTTDSETHNKKHTILPLAVSSIASCKADSKGKHAINAHI